jgi:translation initiation factor 4E
MCRVDDVGRGVDFHLFRMGIRGMWEDAANVAGGRYIIRVKKGSTQRIWEELMLSLIGDDCSSVVRENWNGLIVSVKLYCDVISIWVRDSSVEKTSNAVGNHIKQVLKLGDNTPLEYAPHQT